MKKKHALPVHRIEAKEGNLRPKVLKTCAFLLIFAQKRAFLRISCKFLLIFALIFGSKMDMSYKIAVFTTVNDPDFENSARKPPPTPYFESFFVCFRPRQPFDFYLGP
jgi:hypothetical protein